MQLRLDARASPKPTAIEHIAVIMDGNRRWAQRNGLPTKSGYEHGARALRALLEVALAHDIRMVTAYGFSTENWKRDDHELSQLFSVIERCAFEILPFFASRQVRFCCFGDISSMPLQVKAALGFLQEHTRSNRVLTMNLAMNYGGRSEVVKAAREIAMLVAEGTIGLDDVCDSLVREHLYTRGHPDPDIIIRTGGESRLSNFLLYQSVGAQFIVLEEQFPDLSPTHFIETLRVATRRQNAGSSAVAR